VILSQTDDDESAISALYGGFFESSTQIEGYEKAIGRFDL